MTTIYVFRHQESTMNRNGFGSDNAGLTDKGKSKAQKLAEIIEKIKPDMVFTGTLIRHKQTAASFSNCVVQHPSLDAIVGGPLIETEDKSEIERAYGLARFSPAGDGYYHGRLVFSPVREQVFPYGLYCSAFVDKALRKLVFPDAPLHPIEESESGIKHLHEQIGKSDRVVCLGSCSALALNIEYWVHRTVGEQAIPHKANVIDPNSHRLYPQPHSVCNILEGNDSYDLVSSARWDHE